MRFTWWIATLWPGCLHAWRLGHWGGLAVASAFAAMVNVALLTTFVWPQWLGPDLPPLASAAISWLLVLGLWSAGLVWLRRDWPKLTRTTDVGKREVQDVQFQQAQHEYLKGHWIESETLVARILDESPRDVEARLLFSSIQRRTGRRNDARQTLRELKDDESAGRWQMEILAELAAIEKLEGESNARSTDENSNDEARARAA